MSIPTKVDCNWPGQTRAASKSALQSLGVQDFRCTVLNTTILGDTFVNKVIICTQTLWIIFVDLLLLFIYFTYSHQSEPVTAIMLWLLRLGTNPHISILYRNTDVQVKLRQVRTESKSKTVLLLCVWDMQSSYLPHINLPLSCLHCLAYLFHIPPLGH